MEDINSPVFAQAKIEYTKQLIDVLKIPGRIYGLWRIIKSTPDL